MVTSSRPGRMLVAAPALVAACVASGCGASARVASSQAPLVVPRAATPTPTLPATAAASPALPAPPPPAVVATALGRLSVYRSPSAPVPYEKLSKQTPYGSARVVLVTARSGGWVQALLPQRPNGSRGWVQLSQVRLSSVPYRVDVSLRTHRASVYLGGTRLLTTKVATGMPGLPTARGTFYVTDVLKVPSYQPWYGPYALALSGYSPVLQSFEGGDAELAMHGTDQPQLLGTSASHGCIRMSNAVIYRLAHLLPVGTPVTIH